eukprot:1281309-Pleurochrysis_carterae.AAC.1
MKARVFEDLSRGDELHARWHALSKGGHDEYIARNRQVEKCALSERSATLTNILLPTLPGAATEGHRCSYGRTQVQLRKDTGAATEGHRCSYGRTQVQLRQDTQAVVECAVGVLTNRS